MKRLALLLTLFAFAFAPSTAKAQSDDFTYPDGAPLSSQPGWAAHGGAGPQNLLVMDGQAVIQHGDPDEDVSLAFADVTSGTLTATFDITVNSDVNIGDGLGFPDDFEYFAHFFELDNQDFNFTARLSVVPPTGDGNYSLGISSSEGLEDATLTNDFIYGETVAIELVYDVVSGIASLTVNGETIVGNVGADAGSTINRFALRQSDSINNETVTVDNLVINGVTSGVLLGDVDRNGEVNFFDIQPFIDVLLSPGAFQAEADCDENGEVNFFDIQPFIDILLG